jgi:hypothetical protein
LFNPDPQRKPILRIHPGFHVTVTRYETENSVDYSGVANWGNSPVGLPAIAPKNPSATGEIPQLIVFDLCQSRGL